MTMPLLYSSNISMHRFGDQCQEAIKGMIWKNPEVDHHFATWTHVEASHSRPGPCNRSLGSRIADMDGWMDEIYVFHVNEG